jgi:hypothetical protein
VALRGVGERGRDEELPLRAHVHEREPQVPPLDHHRDAEHELEGLAPLDARIELRPVGEPAGVVDLHAVAGHGRGAGLARGEHLELDAGGHRDDRLRFLGGEREGEEEEAEAAQERLLQG